MSRPQSQIRYGNRIISQKQDFQSLQKHYQSLKRTRPMTGTTHDRQTITINNKKKQMVQQNRFTQIQRQNRMLFHKISSIMSKGTHSNTIHTSQSMHKKFNKTLNGGYRKKQLQNIEYQNAKLLKRLKQKTSSYKVNDLNRDWQKKKAVIKKMALYPFIINDNIGATINRQKIHNSFMIRNKLNSQSNAQEDVWEIRRVRNLNGFMFLITIKLQENNFYIIGDMKQQRNIKIIQLQRAQAEQFIRDQCNGNVQKIFDLLKYDKQSGDMYLVGNDFVQEDEERMFQEQRRRAASQHGNRINLNGNRQRQLVNRTTLRNSQISNFNRNSRNNSSHIPPRILSKQLAKENKLRIQAKKNQYLNFNNQQQIQNENILSLQQKQNISSKNGLKVKINQNINFQAQTLTFKGTNTNQNEDRQIIDERKKIQKQQIKVISMNDKQEGNKTRDGKKKISEWVKIQTKQQQQINQKGELQENRLLQMDCNKQTKNIQLHANEQGHRPSNQNYLQQQQQLNREIQPNQQQYQQQ